MKMKMKILFIQDSLGSGGAERSNAYLCYYLKEKGVDLKIVLLDHKEEGLEQQVIEDGFDVVFLKEGKLYNQLSQLKSIIADFKPDLVHAVLFRSILRARLTKFLTKFKLVESLVNSSYDKRRVQDPGMNKLGFNIYKKINRSTHFITDNFVAITDEVKSHFVRHLKIEPSRVKVIYRGRQPNPFVSQKGDFKGELLKEFNLPEKSQIFTNVARQEFQKGQIYLLKAIKEADKILSQQNVVFLLCGIERNATPELKKFLKENDLKTKIIFTGYRNDINRILAGSDAFVFPSLFEGLGGALIEAQAAKLPIVCSDLTVFEEVVKKKENALFFETGNEKDLAEKLTTLALNSGLQKKMGKKSLQIFEDKFKIDHIHDQVYDHFQKLIA
jgi:glycosyltransferase involved in cell wall biosynthesis